MLVMVFLSVVVSNLVHFSNICKSAYLAFAWFSVNPRVFVLGKTLSVVVEAVSVVHLFVNPDWLATSLTV
jgi:hypothetical protein